MRGRGIAQGLALLIVVAACGGKSESDGEESGGGSGIGGRDAGGAGVTGTTGGSVPGEGGAAAQPESCGIEGEACCPDTGTMAYRPACFDSQLQCCGDGACHLSCDEPDESVYGWSSGPDCDLSPYKTCQVDDDCVMLEHRINCCGSTRFAAVATEHEVVLAEMASRCVTSTTCDCEAVRSAEDGAVLPDGAQPWVSCDGFRCMAHFLVF